MQISDKELTFGHDVKDLERAFDMVKDKNDWKAPVDAWIRKRDKSIVADAIVFYTGCMPAVVETTETYCRIVADGYRMGPCGDF